MDPSAEAVSGLLEVVDQPEGQEWNFYQDSVAVVGQLGAQSRQLLIFGLSLEAHSHQPVGPVVDRCHHLENSVAVVACRLLLV